MTTNETYFLNPYNFVRYLKFRRDLPDDPPNVAILGQCPPPSHDRWVGYSGQIDCRATVVTPLFIASAEDAKEDEEVPNHKHFQFFNINGEKKVPASSLRGMFRNIYEAVTNSRFGTFHEDKFPLEHREAKAPDKYDEFVPARVCAVFTNGKIALEKLDCRKAADNNNVMNAAWIHAYRPSVRYQGNRQFGTDVLPSPVKKWATKSRRVAALVKTNPTSHHRRPFSYYEVDGNSIVLAKDHHTLPSRPGWEKVFGYVHVTGPNIEKKHHERLFFRQGDSSPTDLDYKTNKTQPFVVKINADVVAEYNQRLQEYYDRNQRDVKKPRTRTNWPLTSSFVKKNKRLKKGDLVYLIEQDGRQYLRPVSIPRLPYENTRQALLPEIYHPASSKQELSPADRLFGWVSGSNEEAYAGRIQFSQGEFDTDKLKIIPDSIPLAILSTPKPTTTRFYLSDKSWQAQERDDKEAGYNNLNNRLRGRKMYRHFMPSQFKKEVYQAPDEGKSDQNRTVHGVVDKTSEFTFSIRFENLHAVELGALLWAIEMEEGMHHRLGMAKPLGFGSLQVKIDRDEEAQKGLRLFNAVERYRALGRDGLTPAISEETIKKLVFQFKQAMVMRYLSSQASQLEQTNADEDAWVSAFATLDNMADLMALLKETPKYIPIHYPRLPGQAGENFQWFMNNKKPKRWDRRNGVHISGEWLELEVPAQEVEGNGLLRNVTGRKRR